VSLAQLAIRLTSPGVTDIYQGDEHWNLALVDPDNRRAVNWDAARQVNDSLSAGNALTRDNAKIFATKTLLGLRHRHLEAFATSYDAVPSSPDICSYKRGNEIVVAVATRKDCKLPAINEQQWNNVLAELESVYPNCGIAVYERQQAN
jgi:(1->4)-alpha-D-glucan 1-alpha-D-glucosylmutase